MQHSLSACVLQCGFYLVADVIVPFVDRDCLLYHVIVLFFQVEVYWDSAVEVLCVQFYALCSQTEKCVIRVQGCRLWCVTHWTSLFACLLEGQRLYCHHLDAVYHLSFDLTEHLGCILLLGNSWLVRSDQLLIYFNLIHIISHNWRFIFKIIVRITTFLFEMIDLLAFIFKDAFLKFLGVNNKMIVVFILMELFNTFATETAFDSFVLCQQWIALLCTEGFGTGDVFANGTVACDVLLSHLMTFGAESWDLVIVVLLIELLVVPCVFWDVLFVCYVSFYGPYQVFGDVSGLSGSVSVSQVENVSFHEAAVGWLISAIQELTVGLKVQETGYIIVYYEGIIVIFDGVLKAEVIPKIDKVDDLLLLPDISSRYGPGCMWLFGQFLFGVNLVRNVAASILVLIFPQLNLFS